MRAIISRWAKLALALVVLTAVFLAGGEVRQLSLEIQAMRRDQGLWLSLKPEIRAQIEAALKSRAQGQTKPDPKIRTV